MTNIITLDDHPELVAPCTGCDVDIFGIEKEVIFALGYLLVLFVVHYFIRKHPESVFAQILRIVLYVSGGLFIMMGVVLSNDEFRDPSDWGSVAMLGVVLWFIFSAQFLVTHQSRAKTFFTWTFFWKNAISLVLMQALAFLPMLVDPYHPNYVTETEPIEASTPVENYAYGIADSFSFHYTTDRYSLEAVEDEPLSYHLSILETGQILTLHFPEWFW